MWKYVSRRIRDTFERSANHFEKRSSAGVVSTPGSPSDDKKTRSSPACRWFPPRTCWSSYKSGNDTNSKKWNFEHLNRNWIGAITWSSALVLGWYTSQLIHLKYKYHSNEYKRSCRSFNNLLSTLRPYISCMNKNVVHFNSDLKIEKIISNFTPTVHLISNEQNGKCNNTSASSSTSPDTSDNDLGDVLNSIENRLGLAAIENGQHQEGLNLLRSAANRRHAPALYNLGLCYEMGLGVSVDEKMAMELYRSAAALEHPGALYNLGIYYGQGRGGLQRDLETATRLLRLAAVQGQQNAVDALKALDVDIAEAPLKGHADTWTYRHNPFSPVDSIVPTHTALFVENVNFLQTQNCEAAAY